MKVTDRVRRRDNDEDYRAVLTGDTLGPRDSIHKDCRDGKV